MKNLFLILSILAVLSFNSCQILNAVSLPEISFYPDTLDGGGQVTAEIIISDDLMNFSNGRIHIYDPKGELYLSEHFYEPIENGRYNINFEVSEYDISGYWYVGEINLYYHTGYYTFFKDDINKGFTVINTIPDTIPPQILNIEVSKDTAYMGDTTLITIEIEDTLSGLAYCYVDIYNIYSYFSEYYDLKGEETDTLYLEYIINKYERPGPRKINVELSDNVNNYIIYNEDSLHFSLVVLGTIVDTIAPSFHSASVVNNSENDSILLNLVIKDDISGIEGFYVNLYNYDNDYDFDEDDFVKLNDSLYRCNLINKYPYLSSGNYSISVNMNDSANNHSIFGQTGMLSIFNVNSDNEPPKVLSVEFNKDTLLAGDMISLQIVMSDNKSGISNFAATIRNVLDPRNSIPIWEYFKDTEITEYTFTKSYTLSEFGPGGQWELDHIFVFDYAELFSFQTEDLPSFYYYPKYFDDEPPVFHSISFDPLEVNAGDTVIATIVASDNLSGIDDFDYEDDISEQDYFFGERKWLMTELNTYQTEIPVNEFTPGGYINYELWSIRDRADNYLNLAKEGVAFKINNVNESDNTPPVFDSLNISKEILTQEDTLELIFYVHDDLSGIDPTLLYTAFEQLNEEDNDDSDDFFGLIFLPDYNDENSYKVTLPAKYISPGEYLFNLIFLVDKAGNANDIVADDYVEFNYVFEVTGEYDPDNKAPVLTDITVSPKVAEPSDTVRIKIKALDERSVILTIFANIRNTDGIEEAELFFKDWQITQVNDTFICSGEYIVPQNATNGKWIIEYIEIYDHYLNDTSLEYNIDYTGADFMVSGGHSYPNRHPTWVVHDIDLALNTGEVLEYKIPDFIVADIDGDELSFSAGFNNGELPSWIHFSVVDLKLILQPGKDDRGHYTVYILASDPGGLKDSLEINIEVLSYEGTGEIIQNSEIHIYPNPSAKYVNIVCQYNIESISIYDFNGKLIYSTSANRKRINVEDLEKGIYILKVATEKLTFIERLVIQ